MLGLACDFDAWLGPQPLPLSTHGSFGAAQRYGVYRMGEAVYYQQLKVSCNPLGKKCHHTCKGASRGTCSTLCITSVTHLMDIQSREILAWESRYAGGYGLQHFLAQLGVLLLHLIPKLFLVEITHIHAHSLWGLGAEDVPDSRHV